MLCSKLVLTALLFSLGQLSVLSVPQCPFQCVPGLEKIGIGVDLTWLTPRVQSSISPVGYKQAVVNLTSEKGYVWSNPYTNDEEWGVWDQVSRIYIDSETVSEASSFSFGHYSAFSNYFDESVNVKFVGLFSAGEEFKEFYEQGITVNASFVHFSGTADSYIAQLKPDFDLGPSDDFVKALTRLPTDWTTPANWEYWDTHFGQFGTHYISEFKGGGNYYYYSMCSSYYMQNYGYNEMTANAKLDYDCFLKADGAITSQTTKASDTYLKYCDTKVQCYGGNGLCHTGSATGYANWVDSCHTNPWLLEMDYTVNYGLLQDYSATLYALHQQTTTAYIIWSSLAQMDSMASDTYSKLVEWQKYFKNDFPSDGPHCLLHINCDCTTCECGHCSCSPYCTAGDVGTKNHCRYTTPDYTDPLTAWKGATAKIGGLVSNALSLYNSIHNALLLKSSSASIDPFYANMDGWNSELGQLFNAAFGEKIEYICQSSIQSSDSNGNFEACCVPGAGGSCACCNGEDYQCHASLNIPIAIWQHTGVAAAAVEYGSDENQQLFTTDAGFTFM